MAKESMIEKLVNKTLMPRSYIQYCRSLEIQLPGTLIVTIFEWFPFKNKSDRLKVGQDKETGHWDLEKGDRDRLIRCHLRKNIAFLKALKRL